MAYLNQIKLGNTTYDVKAKLTEVILNDTSNWRVGLQWRNTTLESGSYLAGIGRHNTGGNSTYPGTISIIPYATNTEPWGGTVGLFLSKDTIKFENKILLHSGNYTDYTVTKTGSGASGIWGISITGNAATATKIYTTSTNPSTGTTYAIPFMASNSSGNQSLLTNNGIGYWSKEGTTSDVGTGELKLGNSTASGTAGNKRGMIYMYGTSSGYTEIIPSNNTTSNIQIYLPSKAGTMALDNVFGASGSTAAKGLVPAPSTTAGTTKYLREDGTWVKPPNTNTTYSAGTGLTLSSTTFSVSKANASTILNLLGAATANMTSAGYIITSDASDPSDGLFYKRPVSNVVNATLVKAALGTGTGTTKYLREDGTWVKPPNTNTTYSAGTGLTLDGTTFKVTQANVHTMINLLGEGTSDAQGTDYLVAQYAGGGTSTTTYHRRPVNKIVNAGIVRTALSSVGALNCNAQYNFGLASIQAGSNCPSGAQYGSLLTLPYRKATGNTKPDYAGQIFIPDGDDPSYPNSMFFRTSIADSWNTWRRLWKVGDSVTGAVWNDYAECRESKDNEPGYVVIENGDDTLSKSTERLQQFAGIVSDTWGFSQGETDKAKTHIAVAGRVLAYTYKDRNEYKPGDAVCTAPGGTVDIMTEEEIIKYPHRIVGTVSCVPDYEEWGGGDGADREPVKVNGRIWIKVK